MSTSSSTTPKSVVRWRGNQRNVKANYTCVMQFNPKGLVVTAVFFGLLWFALERGFGLVALAAVVAVALDAGLGWGLLGFIPEWSWPRWRRFR